MFRLSGGRYIRYSPARLVVQATVAWEGPSEFTTREAPGTTSQGVIPPGPEEVLSRTTPPTIASIESSRVAGSTRVLFADTLNTDTLPVNPALGAAPAPPTGETCR